MSMNKNIPDDAETLDIKPSDFDNVDIAGSINNDKQDNTDLDEDEDIEIIKPTDSNNDIPVIKT